MPATSAPKLVIVIVEDWFFVSHFLAFGREAIAAGFDVTVVTRVREHRGVIEALGARVIGLEGQRGSINPFGLTGQVMALREILAVEKPDILHLIGLRPIVFGSLAARAAGIRRRIAHVTGMGLLGTGQGRRSRAARTFLRRAVRPLADGAHVRFLFENPSDPLTLGLSPMDRRKVTVVGGAGVDPEAFKPAPLPQSPPLRLALIARMVWSKGVDVAVEAVGLARSRGVGVELSLYGEPDPENPRSLPVDLIKDWASRPGISWHGRSNAVNAVWAEHHAGILPSRGGEGLPRSLIEVGACGRAILTTDVPGCRDFVRDGTDGYVVPPDDVEAMARAIAALAADPALVARLGANARARVLDGHTEAQVAAAILALYSEIRAAGPA